MSGNYFYHPVNKPCNKTPIPKPTPCCDLDASCVIYTSFSLPNIGVEPGENLEKILQNINAIIGNLEGIDWSSFDYNCYSGVGIDSAAAFASVVTSELCTLKDLVDTFITTTYAGDIQNITDAIDDLDKPELTSCPIVDVKVTDNLKAILTKILTSLCSIYSLINPVNADWSQSHVVPNPPENITDAFDLIIDWIDLLQQQVNSNQVSLPTFDNRFSCLSTTGMNDLLYDTVVAIRDAVCSRPEYDIDNTAWTSCITNPAPGTGANLQITIDTILAYLHVVYVNRVAQFDPTYFSVSDVTPGSPCSGKFVTLTGLVNNKVALSNTDSNPGFLTDKLVFGSSFTTSYTTVGGVDQLVVGLNIDPDKVKADGADTSSGYLIDKIEGKEDSSEAIEIQEQYNSTTDKVDLIPVIDYDKLVENVLDTLSINSTLYDYFSQLVCDVECSSTTTTTAAPLVQYVEFVINNEGVIGYDIDIDLIQNSPSLPFFELDNLVLGASGTLNTGTYLFTSVTTPLSLTINIVNNNNTYNLTYSLTVLDINNNLVNGSSNNSGSITPTNTLVLNNFELGDTLPYYKVRIDLGLLT